MSADSTIAKLAYYAGCRDALAKLGTAPGTIEYAPRQSKEKPSFDYQREDLWQEFDREPHVTGEESALGMPSAGGVNKTGGLEDGQYGVDNGPYAQGGFDADQEKVDRDKRLSSAIQGAFRANEEYDKSYGVEPPNTQPHGTKAAFTNTTFNVGASLRSPGIKSNLTSPNNLMQNLMKPGQMPKVRDPRSMKPPGMNLQHDVQTHANAAAGGMSMSSPGRRLMGDPT